MKSSFLRSASRRASSIARFRSVMSRAILEAPMTRPVLVDGRGDRQGDVDPPAVLRDANCLEVLDPFSAAQASRISVSSSAAPAGMIRVIGRPTASSAV